MSLPVKCLNAFADSKTTKVKKSYGKAGRHDSSNNYKIRIPELAKDKQGNPDSLLEFIAIPNLDIEKRMKAHGDQKSSIDYKAIQDCNKQEAKYNWTDSLCKRVKFNSYDDLVEIYQENQDACIEAWERCSNGAMDMIRRSRIKKEIKQYLLDLERLFCSQPEPISNVTGFDIKAWEQRESKRKSGISSLCKDAIKAIIN